MTSTSGGKGGSVPTERSEGRTQPSEATVAAGTEKKKKGVRTSSSSQSGEGDGTQYLTPAAALQSVLAAAHVFLLAPARQRAAAEGLSRAGVTVDGLRDLVAYTEHRSEDEQQSARILATVIGNPECAAISIRALAEEGWRAKHEARMERDRQEAQQAAQRAESERLERNRMDYRDAPQEGEDEAGWRTDRNARIAFCCVEVDGRDPANVAADIGVDVAELERLIERGRHLQSSDREPVRVERRYDDPEEGERRRQQFVEDMRRRRAGR